MITALQPGSSSIMPFLLVLALLALYVWARRSPKPAPRCASHPIWRWLSFALGLFLLGMMLHKQIQRPVESSLELTSLGPLHRPDPERKACPAQEAEKLLLQSFIYSKALGRLVSAEEKLLDREALKDWTRLRCEWRGYHTKLALTKDSFNSNLNLANGGGTQGSGIWAYRQLAWQKQSSLPELFRTRQVLQWMQADDDQVILINLITHLRADDRLIPIPLEELSFSVPQAKSQKTYPPADRGLGTFTKCDEDFPPSVLLWLLIPWLLSLPFPRPARAWPLLTITLLLTMAGFDAYAKYRDPAAKTCFFR